MLVRRQRAERCLIIFVGLVLPPLGRAGFELLLIFRVCKANLNASPVFPDSLSMEFFDNFLADLV